MIFAAPTEGPSGFFPDATGESKTLIKVPTDSNGIARANLQVDDLEGVFSVGVAAEGYDAFSSFAFTVLPELPTTATAPMDVRLAVEQEYLEGEALSNNLQLSGPFFVPAGSIITDPAGAGPSLLNRPMAAETDSWFPWVDEAPMARFEHNAQWLLIDAQEPAETAIDNIQVNNTT